MDFDAVDLVPFLAIGIVIIVSILASRKAKPAVKLQEFGMCPPHRWHWEEIKDHNGVVHHTRITCQRCGPLNKPKPPEPMDY